MASRDEIVRFVYDLTGDEKLAKATGEMLDSAAAGKQASAEITKYGDALKSASTIAAQATKALSLKSALAETTQQLDAAKKSLAGLEAEFSRTDTSSRKITKAFADAEKAVEKLTTQQNKQQVALAKTEGALKKAGENTANLAAVLNKAQAEGAAAAQSLAKLGDAGTKAGAGAKDAAKGTKDLATETKSADDAFTSLRNNLGTIISVAAAVSLALKGIQFGKESIGEAADVEQALSRVQAIAKTTAESFEALSGQIQQSARDANVSTSAAASAASALAEQGQSAEEIYQSLTPTILLARDANIELSESAGIVDDTLDQFGKSADEAASIVDKLVVASKGSKDGLAGMAQALKQLAPDARALGLDFDSLVSILGLLQQNGIDSSKAVRALRSVFQDLKDPTSELSKELGGLGDSSGDFAKAITTIRNAGAGGEKAIQALSGAAQTLVRFLVSQGPSALSDFAAGLQNVQGEALKTRQAIDNNLKGAFTSFKNSLDALGAGLAESSLGPLREELVKLSDRLNAFADSPAFSKLKESLRALFESGVAAFDQFISNVDFDAFAANATVKIKEAADSIKEVGSDLATVASALDNIGAAIGVVFRSVAVVFDLAKTAISGLVAGLAQGMLAQSKSVDLLTGSTSKLTIALESVRDSAKDAAEKGIAALRDDSDKLVENLGSLGGGADEAAVKLDKLAVSFANVTGGSAVGGIAQTVSDFNSLTGAVENSANALGILPELFNSTSVAEQAASTASTEHAKSIVAASQAASAAQAELLKLVQSGNASAAAMQQASNAYQKAQGDLDKLTGTSKDAAESQRALAQAFGELKISSQKDLQEAADKAKRALDSIVTAFRANGASVDDVQRAYAAYARIATQATADASQATKDATQATLEQVAASLNLTPPVAAAGAAGKAAGDATASAFKDAKDAINQTSDAARDLAQTAGGAAAALTGTASAATATSRAIASASEGITLISADQLFVLRSLRDEMMAGTLTAEEYTRRMIELMGSVEVSVEQQRQNLRNFQEELDSFNSDIAGEKGDSATQEKIRHEQKLRDLEEEYKYSGTLTAAQYQELRRKEDELHELRMKNAQEQSGARQGGSAGSGTSTSGGGGTDTPNAPAPKAAAPFNFSPNILLLGDDPKSVNQLARLLGPAVEQEMRQRARRST